jgi:hypothetical protein
MAKKAPEETLKWLEGLSDEDRGSVFDAVRTYRKTKTKPDTDDDDDEGFKDFLRGMYDEHKARNGKDGKGGKKPAKSFLETFLNPDA